VQIRDAAGNELVTSIELISPTNKRNPGLGLYRQKRDRLQRAGVHLLEIDLIRRGTRPGADEDWPTSNYVMSLIRRHHAQAEMWPLSVRDRLPVLPVPLRAPDPDVPLDLPTALATIYDEAYYELENNVATRVSLIEKYPHMVVNRTFSKAYGLAGFRVGYLLCDPKLASYFNRVRFPWNVSLVAIAAALAALEDVEDLERKRQNIIKGREYIFEEINRIPGMRAFPSEGNFVLIDASVLNKDSSEIRDRMAAKAIYIRPMSGHNMSQGFIRITVGSPDQNQLFIQTFKEYIREVMDIEF